ncbi:hypothetical protein [Amycolatopsis sp. lyj-23]|uniref:hypothetical protein n=1 Tax=Amycolatopsis sp. lyj-23 TaxID=2789283 RepID=UPI00397E29A4
MTSGGVEFGEIARAMAEALRAGAGGASSATLQLQHTGGAVSCQAWGDAGKRLSVKRRRRWRCGWTPVATTRSPRGRTSRRCPPAGWPAERGRPGQVFEYGRDNYGPVRYVSASVTAMLTEVVEALRADKYENGRGASVDTETGLRDDPARSYDEVISDVAGPDLPAAVAALPGRELVQELYLNDPGDVDLAALEPLESLRLLHVNRAGAVTPAIGELPALESVQITANRVELAAAAGHPGLWALALEGVEGPLDLSVLSTLPRLARLNLTGSAVSDWGPVCALPGLRVLEVDADQARELVASGHPLPRLAALFVAGRTTLRDTSELLTAFGRSNPQGTVTEFSGVLNPPS